MVREDGDEGAAAHVPCDTVSLQYCISTLHCITEAVYYGPTPSTCTMHMHAPLCTHTVHCGQSTPALHRGPAVSCVFLPAGKLRPGTGGEASDEEVDNTAMLLRSRPVWQRYRNSLALQNSLESMGPTHVALRWMSYTCGTEVDALHMWH